MIVKHLMKTVGCIIVTIVIIMIRDLSISYAQERENQPGQKDSSGVFLPSPKGAMLRSVIFPGWGQWYNRKKIKAGLVFLTEVSIIGSAAYWQKKRNGAQNDVDAQVYLDNRNVAFWYLGAAILISMADAYVDAHLAGFDVSPELGVIHHRYHVGIAFNYRF